MNVVNFQETIKSFAATSRMRSHRTNEEFDPHAIYADEQLEDDIIALKRIKQQMTALAAEEKKIKDYIAKTMGDKTKVIGDNGLVLCTYAYRDGYAKLNDKLLKLEHPQLWTTYAFMTEPTRALLLK